jgi:hypothetical protein
MQCGTNSFSTLYLLFGSVQPLHTYEPMTLSTSYQLPFLLCVCDHSRV